MLIIFISVIWTHSSLYFSASTATVSPVIWKLNDDDFCKLSCFIKMNSSPLGRTFEARFLKYASLAEYLGGRPVDTSASTEHLLQIGRIIECKADLISKLFSWYLWTVCCEGLNNLRFGQSCAASVPNHSSKVFIRWDRFLGTVFHLLVVF